MKIIETRVYPFSELSEEGKQKALENNWDINVDHNWWTDTYEDAERIGLKIHESNWEYRPFCKGRLENHPCTVAESIMKEHGESCRTYKVAVAFLEDRNKLQDGSGNPDMDENDLEELTEEFTKDLLDCYAVMLKEEWDYLTTKEAIIETFEANDYYFEENGKMNNS